MNIQKPTITVITATIAATVTSIANAGITSVDEFESLQIEGFESMPMGINFGSASVFGGMGEVFTTTRQKWMAVYGQATYLSHGGRGAFENVVRKYEGDKFLFGSGTVTYKFNEAQKSFGGFFATNRPDISGYVQFYDANDQLIARGNLNMLTGGDWAWNGWTLDQEFTRVKVVGSYSAESGYVMMDSMRVASNTIPAPSAAALLLAGGLVASRRRRP